MPGAPHNALNTYHVIAGCDGHRTIPPPIPTPPFAPHVVVWCVGFTLKSSTSKKSPTVLAGWGHAVGRQHDTGMGTLHIWPNALLPLILLGAGNKSEFGVATVKIPVNGGGTGDMAVAVVPVVGINMQLDCWDFPFPPMPTSVAIASVNTVKGGFTLADFLGGLAGMLLDMAVTWIVNGVISFASGALSNAISKAMGGVANPLVRAVFNTSGVSPSFVRTAAYWLSTDAAQYWIKGAAGNVPPALLSLGLGFFGIGSPMGYSADGSPVGGRAASWNDAVHDYFDPPPAAPHGH